MKRTFNIATLIFVISTIVLLWLSFGSDKFTAKANTAFTNFPVGQSRSVNFEDRRESLANMSDRERLDQMRDWLLLTVISDSGLTVEEINEATFDLPSVRQKYLQSVASFEYGETRSCLINNSTVVAIVPAAEAKERIDALARIADQQRKNLGQMPDEMLVFEYQLSAKDQTARFSGDLTRRESVKFTDLFSPAYGYYESKITSQSEFEKFMSEIDDVTVAKVDGDLIVGGRKIQSRKYRGIRVEDVAAIWQSEKKILDMGDPIQKKIDDFESRWANETYRTESERREKEARRDREMEALKKEIQEAQNNGLGVKGSGFSLDPTFDYDALGTYFDEKIAPLCRLILDGNSYDSTSGDTNGQAGISPALQQRLFNYRNNPYSNVAVPETTDDLIKNAREGITARKSAPLFKLLSKVSEKNVEFGKGLQYLFDEKFGFQAARYDGDLQGTQTGMVLFYTDLLAKLWMFNFSNSTPHKEITGFIPQTRIAVSSAYKKEQEELTTTRLWFGPQSNGFQMADEGKSILFAHTATRVYAASAESLTPDKETQASPSSEAFLGWWNDHYEEIARFEPEYERLNQIMKWSLVIGWLNKDKQTEKLSFLKNTSVDRSNWFSDWVKKHPELKFQNWEQIGFFNKNEKKSKTEALPLLKSETFSMFGKPGHLFYGGVSLADRELIAARTALGKQIEVSSLLRRSNLDYKLSKNAGEMVNFEGTKFNLKTVSSGEATTVSAAKDSLKLRNDLGEVINKPFERAITNEGANLNLTTKVDNVEIGRLEIKNTSNGFKIGWEGRDLEMGYSLASNLSESKTPIDVIKANINIESAIAFEDGRSFLVKFQGSDRYLHISSELYTTGGWQMRVGNVAPDALNYNLVWKNTSELDAVFSGNNAFADKSFILRPLEKSAQKFEIKLSQAATNNTQPFEIQSGNLTIKGTRNAQTGEMSFMYKDLPDAIRKNPADLPEMVSKIQFTSGQKIYKTINIADEIGEFPGLKNGNFNDLASDLLSSPANFKVKVETSFSKGLSECDRLLQTSQPQRAINQVDEMINTYGSRPELLMRKSVAELSEKFPGQREKLQALLAENKKELGNFFEEISYRLHQEGGLPENVWVYNESGDAAIALKSKTLIDDSSISIEEINNAYVFVQDTPGLNNLDWNIPIQDVVSTAVSGNYAKVYKIPAGDIANYNPVRIYTADGVVFRSAAEEGVGYGFRMPKFYRRNLGVAPCQKDEKEKNERQQCKPESEKWAYILTAK